MAKVHALSASSPPAVIRSIVAVVRCHEHKPLREIAATAVWNVAAIVRNAMLCTAVAWLTNWCYAQGNVFSRTPMREQSYESIVAVQVGMFHIISSAMVLVTLAQVLRDQYRINDPHGRAPALWFCVAKLAKRTAVLFVVLLAVIALVVYVIYISAPKSMRPLKLEFYIGCICSMVFISKIDLVAREVLRQETVVRRQSVETLQDPHVIQQILQQQQQQQQAAPAPATPLQHDSTPSSYYSSRRRIILEQQRADNVAKRRGRCSKYWRHFLSTFGLVLFVFVSSVYVQLTRRLNPSHAQYTTFLLFTCASTLLKVAMQELGKRAVLRHNVRDMRVMCVAVGVPTVLIDTQIRLRMMQFGSQQSTMAGTLLVALIEVAMRVGKVWLLKYEMYRRERAVANANSPTIGTLERSIDSATTAPSPIAPIAAASTAAPVPVAQTSIDIQRWRSKLWKLFAAEVYADMAAEYIAIGCSSSILYFYGTHPRYALRTGAVPSKLEQTATAMAQLVVEFVVDVLASMLELRRGMGFGELQRHNAFLVTLFVHLAIVNVQISSAVYLLGA